MNDKKNVWVVPSAGNWAIKRENSDETIAVVKTQLEAYKEARVIAIEAKVELIVQGRNGQIRFKNSFGNHPRGSKG